MAVNDDIFDALVRHQVGLSRLASSNVDAITARLDKYDPQILKIIQGLDAHTSMTAMNKALREIRKINIQAYLAVEKDLTRAMRDLAAAEIDWQHKTVTKALPKDAREQVKLAKPTKKAIRAQVTEHPINGALLEEHINGAEIGRFNRMRDLIRREVTKGGADEAVTKAIKTGIMGTKEAEGADGLLGLSRRSIDQAIRTISNGIAQMARAEFTSTNDDVFEEEQWVAMLESNTCAQCQALDGSTFPIGEGPQPPVHINCRCERIPVVKDWEAMGLSDLGEGTRESMDGEVPETQTYNSWLRGQPAQVQDDILGPSRGQLFRKFELPLDRFVADSGRKLTLDELADDLF